MDNRLMLLALLAGLMLMLGCAGNAPGAANETQKTGDAMQPAINNSAIEGGPGVNSSAAMPAFPADITEDAGFKDTYNELDAVQ